MTSIRCALRFSGVAASVLAWIVIAECVRRNPWFDLFCDAFSDLGAKGAVDPWLYNRGLMLTAALLGVFAVHMVLSSEGKLEVVGGAYMSIAAVFLALIGAFPSGTKPHTFVSSWFFIQAFLAILVYGLGRWRRDRISSLGSIAIFILAVVGLAVDWPSVATIEVYEIALLNAATVLYAFRT